MDWCRFSVDPNFEKFCVQITLIDHQTCQKNMSQYMLVVFVVTLCWDPLLNVQFQPGNRRRRPLYVNYHHTQLGHTFVMSIWNVDAQQRQSWFTWAKSCYIMSVSKTLPYLLVSIMLLSQDKVTIIFTVKYKINNIAFTTKDSFEGQSNWNKD